MENSPLRRSNNDYFLIPISLCQHVLKEKASRSFQVHIALKYYCSGTIVMNLALKKELARDLNVSIRTIELELKKLVKLNWLGKKKETYYVRSFNYLHQTLTHQNNTGVKFEKKDLKTIKGFLIGALISYFIKVNIIKEKKERKGGDSRLLKTRGKSHNRDLCSTSSGSLSPYSFANSILAQVLGCSMSTASLYKNEAAKHNYIKIKEVFRKYRSNTDNFRTIKKVFSEDAHRITIHKGTVVYRMPDLVEPLMRFKPIKNWRKKSI